MIRLMEKRKMINGTNAKTIWVRGMGDSSDIATLVVIVLSIHSMMPYTTDCYNQTIMPHLGV